MKTTTRRSLSAAFALTLALGLGACGDTDTTTDGVTADSPAGAGAAEEETTSEETGDADATDTGDAAASDTGDAAASGSGGAADTTDPGAAEASDVNASALAAIATAQSETGGVAYEIDDQDDDNSWEVDVRVDDRSIEVTVAADGTVIDTENDDLDSDDRAGLDAATITLEQAIEIALAEVGGTLDDAELEEDDGVHYWEVTLDDTSRGDDVEVKVDVTTGEIIKIDD